MIPSCRSCLQTLELVDTTSVAHNTYLSQFGLGSQVETADKGLHLLATMALVLCERWELNWHGFSFVLPKKYVEKVGGHTFLKICATHQPTIQVITGAKCPNNASLANSAGFAALKKARNLASGLLCQASAMDALDDQEEKDDQPQKKPRHSKKRGADPAEALVSFQVPGAEEVGMVTAKRAVFVDEAISVPMQQAELAKAFEAIKAVGAEVDVPKRAYHRTGKFSKKKAKDESEHDAENGGGEEDAEDPAQQESEGSE